MNFIEIFIISIFILGFGFIFYLIFRDPIFMFKSLLRGLKADGNWRFKIIFFPIWGSVWIIDKIFGLKIYINEFEEASISQEIIFTEFDKYILINTKNIIQIENILKSFFNEFNPKTYNYNLNQSEFGISEFEDKIIIKIKHEVEFVSINALIQYIDNSEPKNEIYNVKGIFLNRQDRFKSYFVFFDTVFPLKLIGKTYGNKKMYVSLYTGTKEQIFLNSNIDYFKNFDFDKFEDKIIRIKYKELFINPAHNRVDG